MKIGSRGYLGVLIPKFSGNQNAILTVSLENRNLENGWPNTSEKSTERHRMMCNKSKFGVRVIQWNQYPSNSRSNEKVKVIFKTQLMTCTILHSKIFCIHYGSYIWMLSITYIIYCFSSNHKVAIPHNILNGGQRNT